MSNKNKKTKKQASTDFVNQIVFSWVNKLQEERGAQYVSELDRTSEALVNLDLSKLTERQQRSVAHLVGSVARAAFSLGVDLGKSFNAKKSK